MTDEQLKAIAAVHEEEIASKERERFYALCESHLAHAREKHPFFANGVGTAEAEWYDEFAKMAKTHIKNVPTVENILLAEFWEFLVEMKRGDLDRAREEGADIVAVILRALESDIKPKEAK